MNYSLTILEHHHASLLAHLEHREEEQAAFLLCRTSATEREVRLLVREVIPLAEEHVLSASLEHMSISSAAYVPLLKRANDEFLAIVYVHSHPPGFPNFSKQDDGEEDHLFQSVFNRVHHGGPHGSLVVCEGAIVGRVHVRSGGHVPLDRIRIIGRRFRFIDRDRPPVPSVELFDRQARAFGPDLQPVLKSLHVGVIGAGGTGSAVFEQLVRLGVGTMTVVDPQLFDRTNVNRVHGSKAGDADRPKVAIANDAASFIGLGTTVNPVQSTVSFKSVAQSLRDCDLLFGCTDDQWGRSILTTLAVFYGIPVLDMGVDIDTSDETVRAVVCRVTLLMPGTPCLYCRQRITPRQVAAEALWELSPEEAEGRVREGYLAGIPEPAPAVVAFTTATASLAVSELLGRLTGFMDPDRDGTELLCRFDQGLMSSNRGLQKADCFCGLQENWMKGDTRRFLNLNWRPE